jgi:hypothetical protein
MTSSDIRDSIVETARQLKGRVLYYLSGKKTKSEELASIIVFEVNDSSIKCDRSGEEISISMANVERLASALASGKPVHVDTVFGGSGSTRTPLETIAANAPFCGYLPAGSELNPGPKKLIWFPDVKHALGVVMDATESLQDGQNQKSSN